jgi:hypothetical protein
LSFWAIHSGTTKPSTGCPGSEERSGTAWGLSPPATIPVPDDSPGPLTETRGTGLAAWVTGIKGLLPGDGPCLETDGPLTLAFGPRFGALSDEAGPQPASPARSIRLRKSARHDRDGRMSLDHSDFAAMRDRERSARGSSAEGMDPGPRLTGRPDEEMMNARLGVML